MKKRAKTNKQIDRKRFTRTATKTKAVNLGNTVYRGGIRF